MADQPGTNEKVGNLLLDAMGQDARASLVAKARRTPIVVGSVLFRPGDAITYVPFPLIGTLSLLAQPDDDSRSRRPRSGTRGPQSFPPPSGRRRPARS